MSLEALLEEAARFSVLWRDRDLALRARPARDDDGIVFADDRSGGRYVLAPAGADGAAGVWWLGSEGERRWLAESVPALLEQVARGFTVADLVAARTAPSERASPGVLRWLAAKC